MDSLIHIITTIVTIVFIAAVLYSLTSALRKRHRKAKVQQELAKKEHVKVANLHQYDIKPNDGYYKYPIEEKGNCAASRSTLRPSPWNWPTNSPIPSVSWPWLNSTTAN